MYVTIRDFLRKLVRGEKTDGSSRDVEDEQSPDAPDCEDPCDTFEEILAKLKRAFEKKWKLKIKHRARLSDFEIIRTLGYGKFGRVLLVRHRPSAVNRLYAMKVMNKRTIRIRSSVSCVLFEKKILQATSFPFLIEYKAHFKDNANLYLVLEFVVGGDLFTHLRKMYRFDEEVTKFFAAQITISLEYLHYLGIVHRDIKPENVMVDQYGFIKITDFGLAKYIGRGKTSTKCGTRVYMAPEVLAMKRIYYSFNADWWSLGVLVYEMCVGRVPFEASNAMELLYKIKRHEVRYPEHMAPDTALLIRKLLQPNLGYRLVTASSVKAQDYFKHTNWVALYYKRLRPPFVPVVKDGNDTSNFDSFDEEEIEEWPEDVFKKEFEDF